LNLIDTPGQVDFTYEVSRSLAACEGALLIVDATQGVQAQTLANFYLAFENDLEVLPVINKMDLPSARPEEAKADIERIIGIPADDAPCISAKTGLNIKDVLDQIVEQIPCPEGDDEAPLQALIFDSYYDNYKGAVCLVRVINGTVKTGSKIKMIQTGKEFEVVEVGVFKPKIERSDILKPGDVGYISASIKTVSDISVGDTITEIERQAEPLPGYRSIQPVV
jgi:GTP-binding protein LepA